MNEPWLRIKSHPWTDGDRRGRVLIAHDRLGGRRILRRIEPLEPPAEAGVLSENARPESNFPLP